MPIYEYMCQGCGHEFEKLVRSDTTPRCPQCESAELRKKLSVFAAGTSAPTVAAGMGEPCGGCRHPGSHDSCPLH